VSAGNRLGKDPLAGAASEPASPGSAALRHILDLGTGQQKKDVTQDHTTISQEVAKKFSDAMEQLSHMAATAGVWGWGGPDEGDPYLFMRLMAAYTVSPEGEGVNLQSFLQDVHDSWEGHDITLISELGDAVVPIGRAFDLARSLQAALGGFCGQDKITMAPISMHASRTPEGRIRLQLSGPRHLFPQREPTLESKNAEALIGLARSGVVSVMISYTEETAELVLTA
jgi:hypothetical protein